MIHVEPAPPPAGFEEKVRRPGLRALAEMVGEAPEFKRTSGRRFKKKTDRRQDIPAKEFPSFWRNVLDDLMVAYEQICAYSCFRIHRVTGGRSVDHMVPKSRAWNQAYEWSNYRLACTLLNTRKLDFGEVLDPFEVHDGWFELEFYGYQARPAPELDERTTTLVEKTIDTLGLNTPPFLKVREENVEDYLEERISFEVLMRESPFVARELRRQGRLRPQTPRGT